MADEQRPSPFGRPLPSRVEGGPNPFARPPRAVVRTAAIRATTPARAVTAARATTAAIPAENLPRAFVAGSVAAALGAALWAAITLLTNHQIGWMAVGVGGLVGVAVRRAGHGTTRAFGILGAVLAVGGCLAGNLLTGAVVLAREWDMSLPLFFARLTPDFMVELMTAMFDPIDLLFYGVAVWQGYKFSMVAATDK